MNTESLAYYKGPTLAKRLSRFMNDLQHWLHRLLFRAAMKLADESSLERHARIELQAAGYDLDDKEEGPNKWIVENLMDLLRVFATQGHSGSSAPYCVNVFEKLARYKPLCPLTGEPDEWNEVGDGVWQNRRANNVFKQADRFNGQAYNLDGRVFREPSGACYTNRESMTPVTFPYTPVTEYVDVPASTEGKP